MWEEILLKQIGSLPAFWALENMSLDLNSKGKCLVNFNRNLKTLILENFKSKRFNFKILTQILVYVLEENMYTNIC